MKPFTIAKSNLLIISLFTVGMVNIGFKENLVEAISCPQYYFDYIFFFLIGLGIYKLSEKTYVRLGSRLPFIIAVLASVFLIDWAYCSATGCHFNAIFFLTSKAPIILVATTGFFLSASNQNPDLSKVITLKKLNNSLIRVPIEDIKYIGIKGSVTMLYTNNEKLALNETLRSIEFKISEQKEFYRANRKYIIHQKSIKEVNPICSKGLQLQLVDGTTTLINKNRTADFKRWFFNL
ncbi:MAG: LytTR family DNA-binding domain-containing protein [Cyclobacteriaceae bacterium]